MAADEWGHNTYITGTFTRQEWKTIEAALDLLNRIDLAPMTRKLCTEHRVSLMNLKDIFSDPTTHDFIKSKAEDF